MKPISILLGWILNAIYEFFALFSSNHIANIALCVIFFTIIVKMLMLPLTIKQQKSSRLSSKMNPEITAINEKYKGKTDTASRAKMQAETQAVYDKYGSNPMIGCLVLLISLPIMFALYRVIYAIPAYINDVYDMYEKAASAIQGVDGYAATLGQFLTDAGIKTLKISSFAEYETGILSLNHIIDILAKCNEGAWETLAAAFPSISTYLTECSKPIIEIHGFLGGLNILNNPVMNGNYLTVGILIPIFAVISNVVQTKMTMAANPAPKKNGANADPAAASMKTMNIVMPIMSGVICFMIPIGVGIYWIINSVVQIVQQFFINRYLDKVSIDDMIAKGQAKQAKRRAKLGMTTGNRMAEVAKTATKSIEVEPVVKSTADYAKISVKKDSDKKDESKSEDTKKIQDNEENNNTETPAATTNSISGYANIMKNRSGK